MKEKYLSDAEIRQAKQMAWPQTPYQEDRAIANAASDHAIEYLALQCGPKPCRECKIKAPLPACTCLELDRWECRQEGLAKGMQERDKNRPPIVCLCGSTRFKDTFMAETKRLTLEGKIVVSVGFFGHADGMPTVEEKVRLDELHLRKIDLADEILILNVDGYIGESTKRELAYAEKNGKCIRFLEPEASKGIPMR